MEIKEIKVDFGKTAEDYGRYRKGFPEKFFARLEESGVRIRGQTALDAGTGTGTLARGLARRGARVSALDPAKELLEQARELDEKAGVKVSYFEGKIERTPFEDGSFDLVTAGQTWHWFDRPRAASEIFRVLRPDGTLVICHFDWIPLPGNVVMATEDLILKHNSEWKLGNGTGLHPQCLADVAVAGFKDIETWSFDTFEEYSHVQWRGRVRASAPISASLVPDRVASFDVELERVLEECFPEDPLEVHHRVFACISMRP